jgi:hypothetical protein
MKIKKLFVLFLLVFIIPDFAFASNFIDLKLSRGIELKIPKNWWLLGSELNQAIETSAEAMLDLSSIAQPQGATVTLIRANSMPKSTYAAIGVTSTMPTLNSPFEIASMTKIELQILQSDIYHDLLKILPQGGNQLLNFYGLHRNLISGHPALIHEYRRSGPKGAVIVTVLQIFTSRQEISINLSYRESEQALWRPVINQIRRSITIQRSA